MSVFDDDEVTTAELVAPYDEVDRAAYTQDSPASATAGANSTSVVTARDDEGCSGSRPQPAALNDPVA